MPRSLSILLSNSEISTEVVPTSTGVALLNQFAYFINYSIIFFTFGFINEVFIIFTNVMFTLVGITTTSSL
jgi:hypothetical protein